MKKFIVIPLSILFLLIIFFLLSFFNDNIESVKTLNSNLSDEELIYLLEEFEFSISEISSDEQTALSVIRNWIKEIESNPKITFAYGLTSLTKFANRLKLYVETE